MLIYIWLITGKVLPMHNEVLILHCTRSQASLCLSACKHLTLITAGVFCYKLVIVSDNGL